MNQMTKRQEPATFRERVRDFFKFVSLREALRGPVPDRLLLLPDLYRARKAHVEMQKRVMRQYMQLNKEGLNNVLLMIGTHRGIQLQCRDERIAALKAKSARESFMHLETERNYRLLARDIMNRIENVMCIETIRRAGLSLTDCERIHLACGYGNIIASPMFKEIARKLFEENGLRYAVYELDRVAFALAVLERQPEVYSHVKDALRMIAYKHDSTALVEYASRVGTYVTTSSTTDITFN